MIAPIGMFGAFGTGTSRTGRFGIALYCRRASIHDLSIAWRAVSASSRSIEGLRQQPVAVVRARDLRPLRVERNGPHRGFNTGGQAGDFAVERCSADSGAVSVAASTRDDPPGRTTSVPSPLDRQRVLALDEQRLDLRRRNRQRDERRRVRVGRSNETLSVGSRRRTGRISPILLDQHRYTHRGRAGPGSEPSALVDDLADRDADGADRRAGGPRLVPASALPRRPDRTTATEVSGTTPWAPWARSSSPARLRAATGSKAEPGATWEQRENALMGDPPLATGEVAACHSGATSRVGSGTWPDSSARGRCTG